MKSLFILGLISHFFAAIPLQANENSLSRLFLGSKEGDPASLVSNVSTIYGDYTEIEVDLVVPSPDSLVLSRFYSSRDTLQITNFGGWRFNPQCFITLGKGPQSESFTNAEGSFERAYVNVGNSDGTILTYVGWKNTTNPSKRSVFKIDPEGDTVGISNTSKGNINCWTNQKNNELYFNSRTDSFELFLCSEGRRFYSKNPSLDMYFITHEILPSGNKIFYEFDEKCRLSLIKETNASEKKVLAWIKIEYGNEIRVETSDGKTVKYQFEDDGAGAQLLTKVQRSEKPNLEYRYQVIDNRALLLRKTLPEGQFVEVDYYMEKVNQYKVRSVTTPSTKSGKSIVHFSYGDDYTKVEGPCDLKSLYRYNEKFQLTAIEQYLDGYLYRIHKKNWGEKKDLGNLISTSLEDASGNVFYYKHLTYDSKNRGNIAEQKEYGDVIGIGSKPLTFDENGLVSNQDGHIKSYSYFSGKNTHGFFQGDANGTGVKYWYKKGTNLLLKKIILIKGSPDSEHEDYNSGIKERHFYTYNEDAAITRVIIDDGMESTLKNNHGVTERSVTLISPKIELPNLGTPEVVEHKYRTVNGKSEQLLKKILNEFDGYGNIVAQSIYDANGNFCYTITKEYVNGLLTLDTDPAGNKIHYSYDGNHNLVSETHSASGIFIEYDYDLKNRLICTKEKDRKGNQFETHANFDSAGRKLCEIDQFDNITNYIYDSLGRNIQVTYPQISDGSHAFLRPVYTYSYDLFDNPISATDPKGRTLTKSYNVHGKPIEINHLDGTKEIFKYDSSGNLHHYDGSDGLLQVFSYDYKGRLNKLEYFKRGHKNSNCPFKEKTYSYGTFHKLSEIDEKGDETTYTYGGSGRLETLIKDNQKVEFIYDNLGRTMGVKKWKSLKTFTLEIKEYDFLDNVIEERIEDHNGKILTKKRYIYNGIGQVAKVIGYPQSKESVLMQYEYDGFGRLCKTTDAAGFFSITTYDDVYINDWGQKTRKQTLIDPLGNETEEIFDINEQLVKVSKKDKFGKILSESESSFDNSGNKILERILIPTNDDSSKIYETEWSFNQRDQLDSFTLGKGTSEERTVRFEYNSHGDISAKYNHKKKEPITYRYDNSGNLSLVSYIQEGSKIDYELSYDQNNNITEIYLDSSFSVTHSFDANDMPLIETINDEFGSYQVERTYNGERKIQTLLLPDGSFVMYTYEGSFIKSAKRYSKERELLYSYQIALRDQMGHILEEILPGQLGSRKQIWDESGRKLEISTDFFYDRVLKGGYDPLGNIKKRETALNNEINSSRYDYNALSQLLSEEGSKDRKYSYDSIGNRLQKDGSAYKVNVANQLVEADNVFYTFDLNGNLATKTVGGQTWFYQSNPFNQIMSIKDPEQNIVKFTYDLSGKRLTKNVEAKGKKAKIFRFFYLGETEIGSIDEKGVIIELKVPSNPNIPEAPSIAIELRKETYVPLYDLQRNIICLMDYQQRTIVETYRYSSYGEEEIFNKSRKSVSDSSVDNPWRYQGTRVDKETSLIYFGYRYYSPEIGRWLTPDPAGAIDGPNLYAYANNNPITYLDYFGLSSELNESCGCTQHGHPGRYNAPPGCVCICGINGGGFVSGSYRGKIGSNIKSAISGISHGVIDYALGSLHDLQTAAVYVGSAEIEMSLQERSQMIKAVEQSQAIQMGIASDWMMDMFSKNDSDTVYQSFRSNTTLGLELGSLVAGGYGVARSFAGLCKLAKLPAQIAKLSAKDAFKVGNFRYSNTVAKHFTELVKKGPNAGRLSRPYMNSPLTVKQIMASRKPIIDPGKIPGGLRWDVPGNFRGSEGTWELVLHPETEIIYHFNFK